jgi:hypothetical protein
MKTIEAQRLQFAADLNSLILAIRDKAMSQFEYNVNTNLPLEILTVDQLATHAVNCGLVSAISARHHFGIEPTIELAADLLEDVNAHSEAALLRATLAA